ncbi:MAG: trypsin-like peptidase domain-containing protein, partial [Oscillospiraceae bacterium]
LSDEESYPATLVGTDPVSDIAVIKIDATGLVPVTVGSSAELQVGDEAIAIGNPLGELGGTVTNGIISALNREVNVDGDSMTLLQTNAAINPGNSGGGLFNNRGELVGIVVAKSSGVGVEGLGFAIPIDLAKPAADDLIAHGYVTGRGELGVSILDVKDERTAFYYRVPQMGVYIAEIEDGSAAKKAGLKIGDGITAVDGEKISDAASLKSQIAKHKAGDTFEITVLRDGAEKTVSVTLQESVPEALKAQVAA